MQTRTIQSLPEQGRPTKHSTANQKTKQHKLTPGEKPLQRASQKNPKQRSERKASGLRPEKTKEHNAPKKHERNKTYRKKWWLPQPSQQDVIDHVLAGSIEPAFLRTVGSKQLNWAIQYLGHGGELQRAKALLDALVLHGLANEHSLAKFIAACGICWKPQLAQQAMQHFHHKGLPIDSFATSALMIAYARKKDLEEGLKAWDMIHQLGLPVTVHTCTPLLYLYAERRKGAAALQLFRWMRGQGRPDLMPNARTYGCLVKALSGSKRWADALATYPLMQRDFVNLPGSMLHVQYLSCCANTGDWQLAEKIFADLLAAGIPPDARACTALMTVHAGLGRYDAARSVFRNMVASHKLQPDSWALVALLKAAQRGGCGFEELQAILKEAQDLGVECNSQMAASVIAFCSKASGEPWGPRLALARRVFEEVRTRGRASTAVYNAMIGLLGAGGDVRGMLRVYGLMEDSDHLPDEVTFGALINACLDHGYPEQARDFKALQVTMREVGVHRWGNYPSESRL